MVAWLDYWLVVWLLGCSGWLVSFFYGFLLVS